MESVFFGVYLSQCFTNIEKGGQKSLECYLPAKEKNHQNLQQFLYQFNFLFPSLKVSMKFDNFSPITFTIACKSSIFA